MEVQAHTQRESAQRIEDYLSQFPQAHCPTFEHFGPGVYVRQMIVPAETVATGAIHKTEHLTIVAGHCWLTTDEGSREFIGVDVVRSQPGIKRVIVAIETTVVITVHQNPDDERDLDKIIARLTDTPAAQLLGGSDNQQARIQRAKQEALA